MNTPPFATLLALVLTASGSAAAAQSGTGFGGAHVGAGITAVNHHFVLEESSATTMTSRNVDRWGVGGAIFAGYDFDLSDTVLVGVEGAYLFGGRTASTRTSGGDRVALDPRHGFSATGRVGYAASSKLLLYAKAGYGEHRYRTDFPVDADAFDETTRSFVVGGGAEYRLGRNAALRVEFEHLDGSRNQFMLGLPIRF